MLKKIALAVLLLVLLAPQSLSALETDELMALVAMPLAVAAVAEVEDVPVSELLDFVALLNDAEVRPVQFVETVRYVPVALVEPGDELIQIVRTGTTDGLRGEPVVLTIEEHIRTFGVPDVQLTLREPLAVTFFDEPIIPTVVTTRVAALRRHPHGGPPGQLKKDAGVQTGAEIVHGTRPGREVAGTVVDGDDRADRPGRGRVDRKDEVRPPGKRDRTVVGRDADRDGRGRGQGKRDDAVVRPDRSGPDRGKGHGRGHGAVGKPDRGGGQTGKKDEAAPPASSRKSGSSTYGRGKGKEQ